MTLHRVMALLLCALLPLVSSQALASRKTDVVTLYNGDRITGEVKSLYGGILSLSTDSMGTVSIEWPDIARLQSEYHYELRKSDGERLYGSFKDSAVPGQLVMLDIFGEHPLEWLQVVEIRPIEETWIDRIEIYLSTTVSYTKATNQGQVELNTDISYEDERGGTSLTGRIAHSRTEEESTDSNRWDLTRALWRENRADAYRTFFANYEDNDKLELDYRVGAGAGIGRYFTDTHRTRLRGTVGLQVITEKYSEPGFNRNEDVELFLQSDFSAWKFNTPELNLDLSFTLYPSVTDSGRFRSDSNIRLRWELIEDLYWDVSAWATTDNRSQTNRSTDYSVTTGVGWEY